MLVGIIGLPRVLWVEVGVAVDHDLPILSCRNCINCGHIQPFETKTAKQNLAGSTSVAALMQPYLVAMIGQF